MLFRFRNLSNRFYSTVISLSKTMNTNKCYFRYIQQEEKVDISLLFDVKGSVRQFNFSRKPTESLHVLLTRMKTNIQKVIDKGNKKKKVTQDNGDLQLELYDSKDVLINENSTCNDLFTMKGPVKLKLCDSFYEVVFNSPWVVSMNLPQSILAGFPVHPENFETQYAKQDKCTFNWYKGKSLNEKGNPVSEQHIQWELTGNKFIYTPDTQDIGMKLKFECIPGNDSMVGPAVETISKNLIEAGPGNCPFETRHLFTKQKLQNKSFRCVSYNILADLYCDSDYTRAVLHPYCPPYALHIDYRKQLILKELLGYNSDIICLQEVDCKIFRNCLTPSLDSEGLNGLFYRKGKQVAEGLACFYRRDRFKFLADESIVLAEAVQTKECLKSIWTKIQNNKPLTDRLLDRSTAASATSLQSIDNPDEVLIVANTHLYFHPDADHVRLLQGGIVIYWLMDIQKNMRSEYPDKRISVILCGDFNSVPSCGIYQLYTTGESPSTLPDWKSKFCYIKFTEPETKTEVKKLTELSEAEAEAEFCCNTIPRPLYTRMQALLMRFLRVAYECEYSMIQVEPKLKVFMTLAASADKDEAVCGLSLKQNISLASACGTPPFTNYTAEFADCLDYIFYDKTNLEVEQVVPLPSVEELKLHTALPSVVFPSDHVALISDLQFK